MWGRILPTTREEVPPVVRCVSVYMCVCKLHSSMAGASLTVPFEPGGMLFCPTLCSTRRRCISPFRRPFLLSSWVLFRSVAVAASYSVTYTAKLEICGFGWSIGGFAAPISWEPRSYYDGKVSVYELLRIRICNMRHSFRYFFVVGGFDVELTLQGFCEILYLDRTEKV